MQTKPDTHKQQQPPEHLTGYLKDRVQQSTALARQFLPSDKEYKTTPNDQADPIGDLCHSPVLGIVHRYQNRVLLLPTMSCAATCRFCFRRDRINTPDTILTHAQLETALKYIEQNTCIQEVILSGGDPLTLSPYKLLEILQRLNDIHHIRTMRIHTRLPIVAPNRVTAISDMLQQHELSKPLWMVLHINHVDELSGPVTSAIKDLRKAGIILLSQSVLLAGVNDNETALENLFMGLVAQGIKPYYLHQLDLAAGTDHFRVPLSKGRELMEALRGKISGIALPTYILDTPGGHGKVWAMDAMVTKQANQKNWQVKTPDGTIHTYPSEIDSAG